jgi:hypothetical protein
MEAFATSIPLSPLLTPTLKFPNGPWFPAAGF